MNEPNPYQWTVSREHSSIPPDQPLPTRRTNTKRIRFVDRQSQLVPPV